MQIILIIFWLYVLLGCIVGIFTWIFDVLFPTPDTPLTLKVMILCIFMWPVAVVAYVKAYIKFRNWLRRK